jgi:tetratricopeptide (TPR) repeat protein
MKRISLFAALSLVFWFNTDVNAQETELDSIKTQVENYKTRDSLRVSLLIDLTKYYTTRDHTQSLPLINEAIEIAKDIGYVRGEGYALNALSTYYTLTGELDSALVMALQAEKILLEVDDQENLLITYSTMARIYSANGKQDKALNIRLKNIEIVKNDAPSPTKASYYFYVGKSYQVLSNYEEAETYFLEALNVSIQCQFATGVAIAEGSLGILYGEQGKYIKAIEFLKRTLKFSEKHKQVANMAASYLSIGEYYENLNEYALALENNSKAIEMYEEMNNYKWLKEAYRLQSKYHERKKDFERANVFLKLHYAMVDTLFSISKTKTIEELQTKYETEKKEVEIATLSQKATIQALELKQKNQSIIIGLVVFALLFLAGVFMYRQRMAYREKTQIEVEQRFLRSQLNPHFIFNALLAIQNFMLKNSAEAAVLYLSKFAKLMREILENSRKEFIPVEDEIKMISNYLDIHKMRLNDSFDYQVVLDSSIDAETDTIPPMFVQPFVENAIEHGMANKKENGLIEVRLNKSDNYISIEIRDNGRGLQKELISEQDHNSLATTIIKERMALFNQSLKVKIQLVIEEIKSSAGEIEGTRVELKVPFSYI